MVKIRYSHKEDYRNVAFVLFYIINLLLLLYLLISLFFWDVYAWKYVLIAFFVNLLAFIVVSWILRIRVKKVYG